MLADSALKLSAASPPLNLEADFHSQQLVFARLQPVGVFEEQRDVFAPTPLVPPAGALTWGCCGESTVEAALSFASFLYFASWLPVSGEARSQSERRCLHDPSH